MPAKRRTANPDLDRREIPAYGIIEVADYLRIPRKTVEYWVSGGESPLVHTPSTSPPRFPFMNLLECHILSAMRWKGAGSANLVRSEVCGFSGRNMGRAADLQKAQVYARPRGAVTPGRNSNKSEPIVVGRLDRGNLGHYLTVGEITGQTRCSSIWSSRWEAPKLDRNAATSTFVSSTTSIIFLPLRGAAHFRHAAW
jgi:hypothetical protein